MAVPPKPPAAAMGELDPLIGLTISGRYRVHRLLGQGGMGKVFEAQQIPLGRAVALKVLGAANANASDPEFHKRFFHEAAILAKLKSTNTVTVYDYGRDGDVYFIAMELLSGEPLDQVLASGTPLSPERVASLAAQICRSLREAHAKGVVHRDLKPANIWIGEGDEGEEQVKVLDFGLAKRLTVTTEETNPNVVPGSPKYMAPEAIRQEPIDGRTDMYSLGVIMFEMLTGKPPFDKPKPMDTLLAHLQQPPPPLRSVNPAVSVPPNFQRLVQRCLAKQPSQRFADMQELLDSLRAIAHDMGVRSDPTLNNPLSMRPPGPPASVTPGSGPVLRLENTDMEPRPRRSAPARGSSNAGVVAGFVTAAALIGAAGYFVLQSGGAPRPPAEPMPTAPSVAAPPAVVEPAPAPTEEAPTAEQAPSQDAPAEAMAKAPARPSRPAPAKPEAPAPEKAAAEPAPRAKERDEAEEEEPAPRRIAGPVQVSVRSTPPGATVLLRGRSMGVTPLSFGWEDENARPGEWLAVTLQKNGYATRIVKGPIQSDGTLSLSGALESLTGEPEEEAPAAPAPAKPEPEPEREGVLQITPQ